MTESIADKVLVVDDDPSFQKLIESVLSSFGLASISVSSAEDALELLGTQMPRGVVLDGLLPGMRGDELAIRLRQLFPREKLPIVFISAFFRDLKSRTHLTRVCQVDAVLHKPITADELRRTFRRLHNLSPRTLPFRETTEPQEPGAPAELLPDYLALSQERADAMRSALEALDGGGRKEALKLLTLEAHRFRGSGASHGIAEISRLGGQIESFVADLPDAPLKPEARAKLVGLVEALWQKIVRTAAHVPVVTEEAGPRSLSVVLLDGPGPLYLSCAEAAANGSQVQVFATLGDALRALTEPYPDVAFVAADRESIDGLAAAEKLSSAGVRSVVLMGRHCDLNARLEAGKRGIDGCVHRLPDAELLLQMAEEFARPRRGSSLLAVDPDPARLGELAEALSGLAVTVSPCTKPEEVLTRLATEQSAMVLIGPTLAEPRTFVRALRSDATCRRIPVLLVAQDLEASERVGALLAGADDVLDWPSKAGELAARVQVCLARHAREQRISLIDPLTGAFTASYFRESAHRAVALARRGRSLALLILSLEADQLNALEHDEAVASIASRLRQGLRVTDVVGRLSARRFGVLLFDVGRDDAQRLLETHLEPLPHSGREPLTLKGSSAAFPESGSAFFRLFSKLASPLTEEALDETPKT